MNCSSKASASVVARALLSVTDISQETWKAEVIEMMAGCAYGKMAWALPSTLTQTAGDRMTRPTAETRPAMPPHSAPRVVRPFQYMDRISTGKLTEAATPKARATRKATFWSLNRMPRMRAMQPMATEAMRVTFISWALVAWPFLITRA